MDWDKFLLKRAKHDLSLITDFQTIIDQSRLRDLGLIYIRINNGKYTLSSPDKKKDKGTRYDFVEKLLDTIDFSTVNNCIIPLKIGDSYHFDTDLCFNWARPPNKTGLLFPCWSFDNWDTVVKEFDKRYVPWESRIEEPYFRGADSTENTTNVRKTVQTFFPENVTLNNPVIKPVSEMMNYKVAFDLPGVRPWSVRSPFIDLSGCASLRILHYRPSWDETPWIQFYEDEKTISGIRIEGSYHHYITKEQTKYLEKEIPDVLRTLYGKRAHNKAEKMREKMRSLTESHIKKYILFVFEQVGKLQDVRKLIMAKTT